MKSKELEERVRTLELIQEEENRQAAIREERIDSWNDGYRQGKRDGESNGYFQGVLTGVLGIFFCVAIGAIVDAATGGGTSTTQKK